VKLTGAQLKLLAAAVLAVCGLVAMRFVPLNDLLTWFKAQTEMLGIFGPILYILIFGIGVACLGPFSIFAVGAGFCFGVWAGGSVSWLGGMLGSVLAFFLSRGILRKSTEEVVARRPFFKGLDAALGGPKGGFIIFLLRLSPAIPYSLSNYVYGATSVRFLPYLWGSALGDLPIGFVYAYLGVAGRLGVEQAAGTAHARSPLEYVVLGVGLVATIAVSVVLTKVAKKALADQGIVPEQASTVEMAA
jgi:uncharacterized membrane protein YdjX (TVP38/TMEM64 family)